MAAWGNLCCWLGLLTCKTVSQITYTVLVETLSPAQSNPIQSVHTKTCMWVGPTLIAMATTFGLGAESSRLPACVYVMSVSLGFVAANVIAYCQLLCMDVVSLSNRCCVVDAAWRFILFQVFVSCCPMQAPSHQ